MAVEKINFAKANRIYWMDNLRTIAWVPVTLHIGARLYPIFFPEGFAITSLYRLIYWLSFRLSLLCMVYLIVESFWRYFDRTGRIWGELNRNSYGVYIIHVIAIGVFGTLLMSLNLPAVVKYPLLIFLTYGVSNLAVSVYRYLAQTVRADSRKSISPAVDVGLKMAAWMGFVVQAAPFLVR